jgi:hypothetical protein
MNGEIFAEEEKTGVDEDVDMKILGPSSFLGTVSKDEDTAISSYFKNYDGRDIHSELFNEESLNNEINMDSSTCLTLMCKGTPF